MYKIYLKCTLKPHHQNDKKNHTVRIRCSSCEDTLFLRCGLLNISSMYRVCNVYVTYMYRISIVFLS